MKKNTVTVSTGSFGTLSWCVWIVFMILYYGCHVEWLTPFWVWFPFWLPFAVAGFFFLVGIFCCLIIAGRDDY